MVVLFISGDLQVPSFPGTPISSQPFLGLDHLTKTAPKTGKRENGRCLLFGFEHGIGRGFTEEFRDTLAATGDLNHAGPVGG